MQEEVDICIIGGGIVGLFTALEMSRAGKTVRVVDKVFSGSSRHNIGEVLLHGYNEKALPFVKYTYEMWQKVSEEVGEDMGFEVRGSAYLAYGDKEATQLKKKVEADKSHDLESLYMENPEELAQKLGIERLPEGVVGAKVSEQDGVVDTGRVLDSLRKLLTQNNVRFWGSDEVVEFATEGNRVVGVKISAGEVCNAQSFLVTAGVWSTKLLKKIGVMMPMRPARCHLLHVSPNGPVPTQLVARRLNTGEIIIKSQRSGQVLVSYTGVNDQAQATWNTGIDEEAVEWVMGQLGQMLPALHNARLNKTSTMTLAITPDNHPYIGQTDKYENLFTAVGFSGKSYAYAAGASHVLKALALGEKPEVDLSSYDSNRYASKLGEVKSENTIHTGDKPPPDEEARLVTEGDIRQDEEGNFVTEGDLPAPDAEATMVVEGEGAKDEEGKLIVEGDLPDADPEASFVSEGEGAKDEEGKLIVEGDLPGDDPQAQFVSEGEKPAADQEEASFVSEGEGAKDEEGKLIVEGDLPDADPQAQFVSEGEKPAADQEEASFVSEGEGAKDPESKLVVEERQGKEEEASMVVGEKRKEKENTLVYEERKPKKRAKVVYD